jgi:hypothetical protein
MKARICGCPLNIEQSWGFERNKYDQCLARKIINGIQFTIVLHIDALKISDGEKNWLLV